MKAGQMIADIATGRAGSARAVTAGVYARFMTPEDPDPLEPDDPAAPDTPDE